MDATTTLGPDHGYVVELEQATAKIEAAANYADPAKKERYLAEGLTDLKELRERIQRDWAEA